MTINWGRASGGALIAEIAQIAAAFGWVAIYSYVIDPGQPMATYEATLPAAYAAIFPRVTQLPKHQLIGLPAVEIYQTARVNAHLQLNVTDICLPVVGSS